MMTLENREAGSLVNPNMGTMTVRIRDFTRINPINSMFLCLIKILKSSLMRVSR